MPSGLKRIYGLGHLHFITFSCYRRWPLLKTARARDIFVKELGRIRDEAGFQLIGYVVMPEYVHLLISEPPQGTPSMVLQKLKLRTARKLRKRHRPLRSAQMRLPFAVAREPLRIVLAGPVLRFQCVQPPKAIGEIELYARESGKKGTGGAPEGLAA